MSTTPITSAASATSVGHTVQDFVHRVDVNKDGQITTDEFGAFLKTMLNNMLNER